MKIWTLMENTAEDGFLCEHGLSLYLETGNAKILFDMGQTDGFVHNAQRLGVDLSVVDFAVVSHGHYDHGGGLEAFLQVNHRAKVYLSCHAFGPHYNGQDRYIGLDGALAGSDRLVWVDSDLDLGSGICLVSRMEGNFQTHGLQRMEEGRLVPEDFRHELYLLIQEGERRLCVSGCSHRGICNIVRAFRPDGLVGGFHLMKTDPASRELHDTARILQGTSTVYYTGHCTGQEQFQVLQPILGPQLHRFQAGTVFTL